MKICVLERGWIFIGNLIKDGDYYLLTNAHCIRRWGTTKGLGEIAENGPTKDTILDKSGTIKFKENQLIFQLFVNEDKWKI